MRIDKTYLLEKFPGKGGWTYAVIEEIKQNKNSSFGWVEVDVSIDGFEMKNYKLMPMGNGKLFLPVKAEIRKKIKKEAGDFVRVILEYDVIEDVESEGIIECLREFQVVDKFYKLPSEDQKFILENIKNQKIDDLKIKLINQLIDKFQP